MTPFQSSNNSYGIGINNSSNSFLRAAEENSRSAFQSIESVVQAFSAVSAMFESTYYAVYNSFRAVVGVADQFYRLKTHLSGIISALAIFRALKYLYRRLLRLFRLGYFSKDSDSGDAWSMAKQALTESEQFVKENYRKNQTNWPLLMFLAVVIGGPYLLWKVLSSIESLNKDDSLWMSGKIDHFIAVSEHDFDAVNVDELSFRRGQRITIAPKEYQPKLRGWLLASVDGKTPGIVPANYIKILGKKIGEKSKEDQPNEINTENMS
jgi:peroxin-13